MWGSFLPSVLLLAHTLAVQLPVPIAHLAPEHTPSSHSVCAALLQYNQVLGFDLMKSGIFSVLPWMTMAITSNVGGESFRSLRLSTSVALSQFMYRAAALCLSWQAPHKHACAELSHSFLAGFLADKMVSRGVSVTTVRKIMQTVSPHSWDHKMIIMLLTCNRRQGHIVAPARQWKARSEAGRSAVTFLMPRCSTRPSRAPTASLGPRLRPYKRAQILTKAEKVFLVVCDATTACVTPKYSSHLRLCVAGCALARKQYATSSDVYGNFGISHSAGRQQVDL